MKTGNDDLNLILDRLEEILEILQESRSPWRTTKGAAGYLQCSSSKIDELTAKGLLPYRRLDPTSPRSPRLYHKRDLVAYLVAGRNPQNSRLSPSEKRQVENLL